MGVTRDARRVARPGRRERFLGRWAVPIVGAVTPVGLIIVNIAAFIVHNLQYFRLGIAILAFISGVMLGSWQALMAYKFAKRRNPDSEVLNETNEELMLLGGMLIVLLVSAALAYGCYMGLANEKSLPNALTFVAGAAGILMPIVMQWFFRRAIR